MVVRFDKAALLESQNDKENPIGVEQVAQSGRVSEAEKIVRDTEQKIAEGAAPAVGVSGANNARGRDSAPAPVPLAAPVEVDNGDFKPTALDDTPEEEPNSADGEGSAPKTAETAATPPSTAEGAKQSNG
jgi:protein phosphatase PTC1